MLKNPLQRFLLVMMLIFVANGFYLYYFPPSGQAAVAPIAYSLFKTELRQEHIAEVTIQGDNLRGLFHAEQSFSADQLVAGPFEGGRPFKEFTTTLPPFDDPELLGLLDQYDVVVTVKPAASQSLWSSLFINLLPWVLIIGVWFYISRRMGKSGGPFANIMNQFGKSGGASVRPEKLPGHLCRCGRARRSQAGAAGNHRLPEGPFQVQPPWRQGSAGGVISRPAGNRKKP